MFFILFRYAAWEKVKAAASSLAGKTKTIVLQILEENRPFIMEQLAKIKEALVEAGKKVLVQITNDIVKIIVGDSVSYSDDSVMYKRSITDCKFPTNTRHAIQLPTLL